MRQLEVYFGKKQISNKEIVELNLVQIRPLIKFDKDNKFYTIIIVDPDAPSRNNPIYKYVLHLLIVNNDQIINEFMPPSPPKNSGLHRYYVHLFEQPNKISINETFGRHKFDLEQFIQKYKLFPVASVMFQTERK